MDNELLFEQTSIRPAKPFLKWAGGKTQLIPEISQRLPEFLFEGPFTYIEPFVGSGAMFFWMMNNYPFVERAVINDINTDLTESYRIIRDSLDDLIEILEEYQAEYHLIFHNKESAKEYYYEKREQFNSRESSALEQAALFIFLNRTCFNGLYRVNRKNEFNVPIGRSSSPPTICDSTNLKSVSKVLDRTIILNTDFTETLNYVQDNSFFYFDPPYKPLNQTSSFNSYAKDEFDDNEQIRLRDFCSRLNDLGYNWILSNSDLKNIDSGNEFFDDLYFEYRIERVYATRMINSRSDKRGKLTELLISNF